jgi:hypothetical protein
MSGHPTVGGILHYRTAEGWRPLHVTSGQGGLVNGWVMRDPGDEQAKHQIDADGHCFRLDASTAFEPVIGVCEGEAEGSWRWPSRVEQS